MSETVKRNAKLLSILCKLKPHIRKKVMGDLDKDAVCAICECARNTLKGNVPLNSSQKRKLSRHRHTLRRLAKSGDNWKCKKKVIVKQAGGFMLPLLAPILGTLLSRVIQSL
jgi:hypothetical protein